MHLHLDIGGNIIWRLHIGGVEQLSSFKINNIQIKEKCDESVITLHVSAYGAK